MNAVGVPILGKDRRVVCVGHSFGGQLCRHYAQYVTSIKTIIQLDSVPLNTYDIYVAEANKIDSKTAY
jgi:pimeloyl-ACP methyl ester carboxylesterase